MRIKTKETFYFKKGKVLLIKIVTCEHLGKIKTKNVPKSQGNLNKERQYCLRLETPSSSTVMSMHATHSPSPPKMPEALHGLVANNYRAIHLRRSLFFLFDFKRQGTKSAPRQIPN
jgi:hypothetical protein